MADQVRNKRGNIPHPGSTVIVRSGDIVRRRHRMHVSTLYRQTALHEHEHVTMRLAHRAQLAIGLLICLSGRPLDAQLTAGDLAWAERAVILDGQLATPERVEAAILAYRQVIASDPYRLEARWKLLRALHYAVDFTTLPDEVKQERLDEAIDLAEAGRESTGDASGDTSGDADRARVLFWSAIAWGMRAQRVGPVTIVRKGVATRMHDLARESLALDPSVDDGGALRLLSRLHSSMPRLPFISGWVRRELALPLAQQAYELDTTHPGNGLILSLALIERAPDQWEEASQLLQEILHTSPRPDFLVEDLAIRAQAGKQLERLLGKRK